MNHVAYMVALNGSPKFSVRTQKERFLFLLEHLSSWECRNQGLIIVFIIIKKDVKQKRPRVCHETKRLAMVVLDYGLSLHFLVINLNR